jgi:PBP1b-binding outer membrane lipoprotein LpoB
MRRWFSIIILAFILTGCASETSTESVDTKELIADTQEILETAEDVYRSGREYTAEEASVINTYEANYEDIEETDVKLLVNSTLMVVYGAKKLDGVDDTFAKDFSYVKTHIEEMEKGAPLE